VLGGSERMKPVGPVSVEPGLSGGLSGWPWRAPGLFSAWLASASKLRGHLSNQAAALQAGGPLGVQSSGLEGQVLGRWAGLCRITRNQPSLGLGRSKWIGLAVGVQAAPEAALRARRLCRLQAQACATSCPSRGVPLDAVPTAPRVVEAVGRPGLALPPEGCSGIEQGRRVLGAQHSSLLHELTQARRRHRAASRHSNEGIVSAPGVACCPPVCGAPRRPISQHRAPPGCAAAGAPGDCAAGGGFFLAPGNKWGALWWHA